MAEKIGDTEAGPSHVEVDATTLTGYERGQVDPAIEKRAVRKLDLNLMPLVIALYLMSSLDRSNIGNAHTAGMDKSLHLSASQYQWLLTVFYIPYILFEWLALMWKLVPPHIWGSVCVLVWGIVATVQSSTQNWAGMMVCRVFLAIGEAGYGPGIPFLLSFFYMRHELGFRTGIFLSAAPFATCFAGALAYGITRGHPALDSWRVLFLVEGLPTVALSAVVFFFLPDSPDKARFLDKEEKLATRARAIRQVGEEPDRRVGHLNFKEIFEALVDFKTWMVSLMFFSCNVSFASLPVFLPSILVGMGFTSINAQGLTAPPYFLSGLICILSTYISDRTQQRGYTIVGLSLMGGLGYVLLASDYHVAVRYLGVFFAAAGVFPSIANILPWVINNQGTDSKRGAGIALLQMIGQCGPVLGTNIYPKTDAPKYIKGMSTCAAFMFFNAFLALTLRTYLAWQNRKLDREEEATREQREQSEKHEAVAVENEGIGYRYFL